MHEITQNQKDKHRIFFFICSLQLQIFTCEDSTWINHRYQESERDRGEEREEQERAGDIKGRMGKIGQGLHLLGRGRSLEKDREGQVILRTLKKL